VETVEIQMPGLPGRSFAHRGTDADRGVLQQVFVAEDYSIGALRRGPELQQRYERMLAAGARPLILDAGANIGASAVYFSLRYPAAHVLALEPAPDNFELLLRNCRGLDVDARRAGIAAASGRATLLDPGLGEWGYRTGAGEGPAVELCAATALVAAKQAAGYAPFIAKIDIEGGEADLFSADTAWIDAFPLLIIELHDWLLPGQANSRNFLQCIAQCDRDFVHLGENVFSIRNG
jgi:FkbM family methyltransferase